MNGKLSDTEVNEVIKKYIDKKQICIISSFASLCKRDKKEYAYLYLKCWPFCYDRDKVADIGNRIIDYNPKRVNQLLVQYIGYDIKFYECSSSEGLEHIRKALLLNNTIVIGMDSYYCWWNSAFRKKHIRHFFIVNKVDTKTSVLLCSDPFFSVDKEYGLSIDCFYKGFENIRVIENSKEYKNMNTDEVCEMLLQGSEQLDDAFQDFGNDMRYESNLSMMFDSTQVETCTLIRKIREISEGRFGIAYVLKKHDEREGNKTFTNVFRCFFELGEMWNRLNIILMKLLLSRKINDKYVQAMLQNIKMISEKEVLCCKLIIQIQEQRKDSYK